MTSTDQERGRSTLTIGLPIRNEGQNLRDFFLRLAACVAKIGCEIEIETLACINGSTDDSASIADDVARSATGTRLGLRTLESPSGKVNAICEIVRSRRLPGLLCFLDTDTLLHESTLVALVAHLRAQPEAQVCYARCMPYYGHEHATSTFEAAQRAYYRYREQLCPRRYFHGRAYLLRDDSVIREMDKTNARLRRNKDAGPDLADGIRLDDVYLSGVIRHVYGSSAIQEVPDAVVSFHPPANESELTAAIFRTVCEIHRMRRLFTHLWIEDKRAQDLHASMLEHGSGVEHEAALTYIALERHLWDAAAAHVNSGELHPRVQEFRESGWVTLPTTKQPFTAHDSETAASGTC